MRLSLSQIIRPLAKVKKIPSKINSDIVFINSYYLYPLAFAFCLTSARGLWLNGEMKPVGIIPCGFLQRGQYRSFTLTGR